MMTKTKYGVELSAATLRALERFGPGAASNNSPSAKQAPLPLSSTVLKVTPILPMAALPKALAASPWANFPTLRAFDAAYLLAGIEPPTSIRLSHPPLVLNMLNLIWGKTGRVPGSAIVPEQRDTITQSEFRGLMAEYAVKPAPVVPAFKPQAAPVIAAPVVTLAPQAVPAQQASTAPAGTATVWTPERKEQARAVRNKYRAGGIKDFAARTAKEFGVTATRLNTVLNEKKSKKPVKKAGFWGE